MSFDGPGPWRVSDPIERAPAIVRTLRAIDPRRDTLHALPSRETFEVDWLDDDRRGVAVTSPAGCVISLHPDEFEVLKWVDEPGDTAPQIKAAISGRVG